MAFDQNEPAYQRALARKAKLLRDLEAVELFLTLYEKFASDNPENRSDGAELESQATNEKIVQIARTGGREKLTVRSDGSPYGESTRTKLPRGMSQPDTEKFVREILIENGRPMSVADLIQRIHDKGRVIGGHDEASNLKTKLWRAKGRIDVIPGAGYWPTDIPCDEVGYHPSDAARS